jgi:hypothetical protein
LTPTTRTRTQRFADRLVIAGAGMGGVALASVAVLFLRSILCVTGICCS